MKVLFCVVLFTVGAVVKAQQDYAVPDYWQNDYDNYDNYNDSFDDSNENTELKQAEPIQSAEIQDVQEQTEAQTEAKSEEKFDVMEDYQIEDNRLDSTEVKQVEENNEVTVEVTIPDEAPVTERIIEEHKVLPLEEPKDFPEQSDDENKELGLDDNGAWGDFVGDDVAPLPVPETEDNNNDKIFEETKDIMNKDQDYLDEIDQSPTNDKDLDKIIEETNKILAESDESFNADDYDMNSKEQEKSDEDVFSENNAEIEEDTPAKVYADLNADLEKLFETFDKLSDDNSDEDNGTDEKAVNDNNVQDYEEKYGKPYNEDVALSWRNMESDAAEPEDSKQAVETAAGNKDEAEEDVVSADENDNYDYENIDDSNLSQIFAENANASNEKEDNNEQEINEFDVNNNEAVEESEKETTASPLEKIDEAKEVFDYVDNYDERNDSEPNADDDIDSVIKQIFSDDIKEPLSYGNDALVDEKQPKEKEAVEFEAVEAETTNIEENAVTQKSVMVDELNSAELDDLMKQFKAAYSEDFDVNSDTFAKHVAPVHITLSTDEPTVITSPGYPESYPANNIVDWIFEGPGLGIELNITEFSVNGAIGDYLLVKPGGLDEQGQEGLIFSHHLKSEKKYRFAGVSRMFVRFQARQTNFQMPGKRFSFSVKLIWPLPQYREEVPEAEAVANPPDETLTLNLAGLTLSQFREIKQDFLELLADMAKKYIVDNNITLGLNTTLEVTQITRTAICNIKWPEYENCVEVTFGVPLHYEEEPEEPRLNAQDLDEMWTNYIIKEEFSERLRSLGITEYAIPSDRTVLMVWLVIAFGVLISMAMLAFALWRFSCFEDYTRMQPYGDTDSIQNEKRNLDLYPTPHQTLPPLYSENDYKWADDKYDDSTRVDMGGFANKSYIRDELYDLESDEDVITARDRKGDISPRDFYDA